MGACFSTHRKSQKGQALPTKRDRKHFTPRHGIGTVMSKNQGNRKASEQNTAELIQLDPNNCGSFARSYASGDEVWLDPQSLVDSESDDDYCSLNGDALPHSAGTSSSTQIELPTLTTLKENSHTTASETSVSENSADLACLGGNRLPLEVPRQKPSADGSHERVDGSEDHGSSCHSSCLPRILPSVSFNEKKVPVSPGLQKARNTLLHLSFKRRSNDLLDASNPFTSTISVENPVAGSQIPFCNGHKPTKGTWSVVEPSTFKVRGSSYLRDKIKTFASEHSIYEPFGVDMFLSRKKISHIAQYVELPTCSKFENLPSLLILNIQIPMYPAAIFLNEVDGEGLNLVLYHKLSDKHMKVPSYFKDMFLKVLNNEVERTRGFTGDFTTPFRERLKILGRVLNPEELHLSVAERKVVHTYNEKPVLSRPQHSFYQGDGYFEVDLDMHRFSYLARKGVESFRDRLKFCIIDVGLTIQGNKPDELPEHVLCCVRTNKLDFTTCKQLAVEKNQAELEPVKT